LRSCGFGHHSSSSAADVFAPATVERKNRSCVTGLFLGGVPLSVPYSLDLVNPPRFNEADRSTTLMGFV
jgi:hypothetical protein